MGVTYSISSLVAIVAEYGKNGLTKEDILRINDDHFKADTLKRHFDSYDPKSSILTNGFVEFRDGKYFLKRDSKVDQGWLERTIQKAKEKHSRKL